MQFRIRQICGVRGITSVRLPKYGSGHVFDRAIWRLLFARRIRSGILAHCENCSQCHCLKRIWKLSKFWAQPFFHDTDKLLARYWITPKLCPSQVGVCCCCHQWKEGQITLADFRGKFKTRCGPFGWLFWTKVVKYEWMLGDEVAVWLFPTDVVETALVCFNLALSSCWLFRPRRCHDISSWLWKLKR